MKTILSEIMKNAWNFFRTTGNQFSECLKQAWKVYKLKNNMRKGIVKFYFQKINGEIREAYGTLASHLMPSTTGEDNRKRNEFIQVYFDTEKQEYRCFKKLNLI